MREPLLHEDAELVVEARVTESGAQEEPVELSLGKRERAFVLDRVLGREEQERKRKLARDPVDGHLTLGHRLEERRLGLRRRPVDLVHEHDVGEDRAGPKLEVPRPLVEYREPGDVRGLEIGGALDALRDRILDAAGDRPGEHGLRSSRNVLEEDVALARERGQDELDLVALPVNDGLDVVDQAIGDRACDLEALWLGRIGDYRLHRADGIRRYVLHRVSHWRASPTSTRAGRAC